MGLWTAVEVAIVVAILIALLVVTVALLAEMWRKRRRPVETEPTGIAVAGLSGFPTEQFYARIGDELVKVVEVNGRQLPPPK